MKRKLIALLFAVIIATNVSAQASSWGGAGHAKRGFSNYKKNFGAIFVSISPAMAMFYGFMMMKAAVSYVPRAQAGPSNQTIQEVQE